MGYGDEIMASGHALAEHRRTGARVHVLDEYGKARWSPLWEGLGWIARPGEPASAQVTNGSHCRPYIEYPFTRESGARFTSWQARDHVGSIKLTGEERAEAGRLVDCLTPFVVIEPEVKATGNPNKQWGRAKWQALIDLAPEVRWVQLTWAAAEPLARAIPIRAASFRLAAAVLERATAAVLPEGGLHHAAGVLSIPAVVLFGGYISPETTGYPGHENIADDGPVSPCGSWLPCEHCAAIWDRLAPETALAALKRALG